MTGGAEINFGGAGEVYFCEFERSTGAREIYPSLVQTNKVKTKFMGFSGRKQVISKKKRKFFTEIQWDFPAEIRNLNGFSSRKQVISKKKGPYPENPVSDHENYENTVAYTNFGIDLHSSCPEPVNFFGAQSSLGGGTRTHLGGHGRGMPPVAPGLIGEVPVWNLEGYQTFFFTLESTFWHMT